MATNFIEQAPRKRWDTRTGWQTVRRWEGPGDQLATFESTELPAGYSALAVDQTLDQWTTVEATYASTESEGQNETEPGLISRTWTLERTIVQAPLIGHYRSQLLKDSRADWLELLQTSALYYRYALERWMKGEQDTQPVFVHPYAPAGTSPEPLLLPYLTNAETANLWPIAQGLANALKVDENPTVTDYAYTLRKNELVTAAGQIIASHANVNRFHSYFGLARTEPSLPAAPLIGWTGLSSWYWLKTPAEIQPAGAGNYQITQDYIGAAKVETWLYGSIVT